MREYYQFLGIKFVHTVVYREEEYERNGEAYYAEIDMLSSWTMECWLYPLMIMILIYFNYQRKKINFLLQDITSIDKVTLEQRNNKDNNECAGTYVKSEDIVNGKPIWDRDDRKMCAFFHMGTWNIAHSINRA